MLLNPELDAPTPAPGTYLFSNEHCLLHIRLFENDLPTPEPEFFLYKNPGKFVFLPYHKLP